jgi:hypothetical protein
MRRQELHRHDYGGIGSKAQGGEIFTGQMEGHGFLEIPRDLVQRLALGDDWDLEAFRHISRLFPGADNRLDRVLSHECLSPGCSSIAQV